MPQHFLASFASLDAAQYDSGDTAWVLISAAMVLFMTPGLALFYAGMVRSKNALAMLLQNVTAIAVVSIVWVLAAYSLAFGPDALGGVVGNLHFAGFANPTDNPAGFDTLTIPPLAFAVFQMMFAVITLALITGATADRLRFGAFVALAVVWPIVVYAPLAHWYFSPSGFMFKLGALDFAGGNVVEMNCGAAGLALALLLRARRGWPRDAMHPHNLPLTLTGAGILWFGWFGFNAGSALAANGLAAQAFVSTHLASCGGLLGWLVVERLRNGRATTLGGASGAIAGLVAITPANGYVSTLPALLIGVAAGVASVSAINLKFRFGYDDSLDVVGVHYVGGLVGILSLGLFASQGVNSGIAHQGLFYGGGIALLGIQALSVLVTTLFSFCATYAVGWVISRFTRLRVTPEQEVEGLDTALHAETAYDIGSTRAFGRAGA
ncbi:MAG: amtB2 [Frankiales bacterium]|nr:amtB2 [Frankiales bacterium]